jgi:outer membrane murein-binding lipoprotein Lpp
MNVNALLLGVILLAGCASQPANKSVNLKSIEASELTYVEAEKIDKFVVKNAQAFKQFDKVILFATQFDKLRLAEETDKKIARNWNESTWKEMDAICQQLDDFAQKIFREEGEFIPVKRGGDDVLAIQFSLVSFMPYSLRYKDAGMDTVGVQTNNAGIGLVTVRGILANAKSGELVAVIEETLEVNSRTSSTGNLASIYDSSNKAAQNLAWRTAFRQFLGNLHEELTTLKYAQIVQQP